MLTKDQAAIKFKKVLPDREIRAIVPYKNVYLVKAFSNVPFEEEMDPFFFVDKETGAIGEFSVLTDGDPKEIGEAFAQANQGGAK